MADSTNPDPPTTLGAAQAKFRAFLASQGYPAEIRWLSPEDLLVDTKCHYWVRFRQERTPIAAEQLYAEGLERSLGIELRAICATEAETFAYVFVPTDDLERQCHLMGHALKLSCPVERRATSTTRNPLKWFLLRLLSGNKKDAVGLLFE